MQAYLGVRGEQRSFGLNTLATLDAPGRAAWEKEQNWRQVSLPAVRMLLEKGANPNAKDGVGRQVWTYARARARAMQAPSILEELKQRGAVQPPPDVLMASLFGDVEELRRALAAGGDVNATSVDGDYALFLAAKAERVEPLRLLLDKGAKLRHPGTNSPLFPTLRPGGLPHLRLLLERGANPNEATAEGATPLMVAATDGLVDHAAALLDRSADPKAKTSDGMTAVHLARKAEMMELLLTRGADPNARAVGGITPLIGWMIDPEAEVLPLVRVLLNRGADPNLASEEGSTPLIAAAVMGNVAVVRVLLEKGAKPDQATSERGTALMQAIIAGHAEVVDALLTGGANPNVGDAKTTPLRLARELGEMALVQRLQRAGAKR